MIRFRKAAIAAVCVLLAAGCTPGGDPSPSTTLTVTAPPAPTTSTSPPASPSPQPTETAAAIDFNRFTEIYVGMSFIEASAASGIPVEGEAMCPWYSNIVAEDSVGLYITALSPYETPGSEIWFFRMQWLNDPTLATTYEMPATQEGITIGSTEADLLAAYPTATSVSFDDYARGPRDQRLVSGSAGNTYVFDIIDGLVTEITWGQRLEGGAQGEYCAL